MLNQQQLLDMARERIALREGRADPVTFYRVSKALGITSAYMTHLTRGERIMSSDMAHKLAALCGIDPAYAMACIEAERATRDNSATSGTWRALAESLSSHAAGIVCAVILAAALLAPRATSASELERDAGGSSRGQSIHYAKYKRAWRRLIRALFSVLPARDSSPENARPVTA